MNLSEPEIGQRYKRGRENFLIYSSERVKNSSDETTNLRKYCRGVRRKKFGGELELRILSQVLKVRIQVYESLGLRTVYPDDESYGKLKWPVVGLTYHKYLCAAPHYQRLVDA